MAELSTEDRKRVWRGLMRHLSSLRQTIALNKDDLLAAVSATDTWIDDNQASYLAALPAAAQSGLTALQKTVLFCVVATMRVGVDWTRRLVGEVD